MAFVRFSDAHHHKEVGSLITWVKLEKNDFASLRNAFTNPTELVSTELPELDKILNALIKEETAFGISDLNSEENTEKCSRLVCALNNSTGGYLLFGVTPEMTKIGLPESEKNEKGIPKIVTQIKECFRSIDGDLFIPVVRVYPLQDNKEVISIQVPRGDRLITVKEDGRIYTIRQREIITLKGTEVQAIIEERTAMVIEARIGKRISTIEKNCLLTKNLFLSMPIIRKFENKSIRMPYRVEITKSIEVSGREIEKIKSAGSNGKSKGNIFFLSEECAPRLKYAYLRYSVPLFNVRSIDKKPESRETIYLVPGGGVFYSKRNYPFLGEIKRPILKIFGSNKSIYSTKFMTAYLKSSFLFWYLLNKLDEKDLYLPNVYKSIRVPKLKHDMAEDVDRVREVEKLVDEILKIEREYLVACQGMNDKKLSEFTNKHNANIDPFAYAIDRVIFQIVGLSKVEIETVESHIRLNDMYLPKETSSVSGGK